MAMTKGVAAPPMIPPDEFAFEKEVSCQKKLWPRDLVLGLLPLLIGFEVLLGTMVFLPFGLRGFVDFRQLYSGGYMIRTGHASQLYDYDAQQSIEETLVPVGQHYPLPINHLAFEELLFVPLSLLPYRSAYLLFMGFNGLLLALSAWLLTLTAGGLNARWKWLPALLMLSFYPVTRALLEGQDSIILLTLLAAAYSSLHRKREFAAGFLIGCGLFKFQVTVPIALLYLMWRRWRFSAGFAVSGAAAGLVSLWLVGLSGAREYAHMLTSMSVHLTTESGIFRYGTDPRAMFNLRGLASAVFGSMLRPGLIQLLVLAASAAVLMLASRRQASLPLATTAASLVSYHFFAHDASVLILPMAVALCAGTVWVAAAAALLLIASLSAIILAHGYLGAIPLLVFYLAMLRKTPPLMPDRQEPGHQVMAGGAALAKGNPCQ